MAEIANTAWYRIGTVSIANESTIVTGVGTNWLTAGINPGATLRIEGYIPAYEVKCVNSDTEIELARPYHGTGISGAQYSIDRNFQSTTNAKLAADVTDLVRLYEQVRDGTTLTIEGRSAYQIAVANGFAGTEAEWLESLKGAGDYSALLDVVEPITYHNAGAHNAIFRGKNLGSAITLEQSAAIRAGTFIDIYPGDYWRITVPAYTWTDAEGTEHEESGFSRNFFVLGCNSMISHGGGGGFATNHIVVMAESNLYNARMNASATTEGGYYGSEMYTKNLLRAEAIVKAAFGEDHILLHPDFISNAVTDGKESGWIAVENRIVDLLSEDMIFGHKVHGAYGDNFSYGISQLPFFAHNPANIHSVASTLTWLRDVHNASQFAVISNGGGVETVNANNASWCAVNPFFLVH